MNVILVHTAMENASIILVKLFWTKISRF